MLQCVNITEVNLLTNKLFDYVLNSKAATSLLEKKGNFVFGDTTGISLLFSAIFSKKPGKYSIICPNLYNAQKVADFISSLIGNENVLLYPGDDLLRSDLVTSSKEFLAQRLYVLNEVQKKKNFILVTHATAVISPIPNKIEFLQHSKQLKVGDHIDIRDLKQLAVSSGYSQVNKIDQSLQFAHRGDIFDIFSINYDYPVRIEFFDDEIESIHLFDIATQSSKESIDSVEILPATDCLFTNLELDEFKAKMSDQLVKDQNELGSELGEKLSENFSRDLERIENKIYNPRTYKYFKAIKKRYCSILDYYDSDLVFINNKKQFEIALEFSLKEERNYLREMFEHGNLPSHLEMYDDIDHVLKFQKTVLSSSLFKEHVDDVEFDIKPLVFSKANIPSLQLIIESYLPLAKKTIFCVSNAQQYNIVKEFLDDRKIEYEKLKTLAIPEKNVGIAMFSLDEGFEFSDEKIFFISSKELFGFQSHASRYSSKFKEGIILKNFDDLKPGDYVVHEFYGIGQFLSIETIEVDGIHRDFLNIQYAGTDKLYVPLTQFRLVRKYAGREGAQPRLSHLNSKDWEKTKKRIKERVNELADRLYQLYSERATATGFKFQEDDQLQMDFENEFPYELTKDQETAIKEIKEDMESDRVMDRLLCGDVGFGKTEVAFRAIFKAISSGKQAAILCPTTLLARQHYELAVNRFANYGVKIAIISRLIPEKQQKIYMKEIADGSIHLVIGTHRLLNKDFVFKDLGLLVVDEEQRFGVEQKERIKELKSNVDVLSLSATPIPRTLQLSLIGVRPVSQITTPPVNRNAIQTYVAPFNKGIVKELIEREISRKGQVFYIHNAVYSINQTANAIQRAIPYARIGVVHGQMDKEDIEDVMIRFYNGDIDVLVATSIIENGIDVPNANLIIVEDADHFGLSQLYQIKGRVGRGDTLAYAYLFYNEYKQINKNAEKRLKAIQDFAELGSGYKIAQRDLMIRGAGDILGPEQAGFIDSVGLDLYLKLLKEVIEEKKTGVAPEPPKPVTPFKIDAYIPEEYASNEDRIQLYQEIENAKTEEDLLDIKKHVRDVYGRLPKEVENLIDKRKIDIYLLGEEFEKTNEYNDCIELVLSTKFSELNGIGNALFESLQPYLDKIVVTYLQKVLRIRLKKEGNWIKDLQTIVVVIKTLYEKFSKKSGK